MIVEEKHAIHVQFLHQEKSLQDLLATVLAAGKQR
jgi:hypothetical protein